MMSVLPAVLVVSLALLQPPPARHALPPRARVSCRRPTACVLSRLGRPRRRPLPPRPLACRARVRRSRTRQAPRAFPKVRARAVFTTTPSSCAPSRAHPWRAPRPPWSGWKVAATAARPRLCLLMRWRPTHPFSRLARHSRRARPRARARRSRDARRASLRAKCSARNARCASSAIAWVDATPREPRRARAPRCPRVLVECYRYSSLSERPLLQTLTGGRWARLL